jgi:E3 ubiquitin-protein ligase HUWE1
MNLSDLTRLGGRANAGAVAASHPLLVDAPSPAVDRDSAGRRQRGAGGARTTPAYDTWVATIEQMIGGGAIEQLQRLLGQAGMPRIESPDQLRLQRNPGPEGGLAVVLDPLAVPQAARRIDVINNLPAPVESEPVSADPASTARAASRHLADRINSASQLLLPVTTLTRWQEESRITQGSVLSAERVARLTNHVINILHGPARALAKEAKEQVEASKRLHEESSAKETERGHDSPEASVTPEAVDEVELDSPVVEAPAAMEDVRSELEAVLQLARSLAPDFTQPAVEVTPAHVEPMADIVPAFDQAEAPVPSTERNAELIEVEAPLVEEADNVVQAEGEGIIVGDDDAEMVPEASGSGGNGQEAGAPVQRMTIEIHGETVDITDTGIDPTFLEALPDDMREEVLNQHFRESRSAAPAPAVPSSINSEFLEALPPDLRAEVLRQEAAEQRREQAISRAAASAAAGGEAEGGEPAGPSDIDPASFLASLAPHLREAVLLEQDDEFLATLPDALVAEVNALRSSANAELRNPQVVALRQQAAARQRPSSGLAVGSAGAVEVAATKKNPVHREAIQLLDKSGLDTLVRLLFFPEPLRKQALPRILIHLCENSRTRSELVNLLLTILQDGTRDVAAVDKSFSQMTLRASKSGMSSVKDTPRRKVGLETPGGGAIIPAFPGESVPNLVAQRCLEALGYLVGSNEQAALFFLTEQEIVVSSSRRSVKKGKGKEKAVSSTTFPIIVLLSLLDRPALLKSPSMTDSLTQLLSIISKSLAVLQKKPSDLDNSTSAPAAAESAAVVAPVSTAAMTDSTMATAITSAPISASTSAVPVADVATDPAKELSPSELILKNPPLLPASYLRLVVNVLDAGECSSKTFQQTLVLIQNLSYLPEAREVISEELKVRAQSLSNSLLPNLEELLGAIKSTEDVRGVTLAKFSPASSLQAKLLRILKTIDWIHTPVKKSSASREDINSTAEDTKKLATQQEKISAIFDSFSFSDLWRQLGECLAAIELRPESLFIATVLLPLIESLMVVSKYVGTTTRSVRETLSPMSPRDTMETAKPDSMENMFLTFTDEHRKILNTMVRNNPALMSGSFAILVHSPKVLEFDNKRSYFFSVRLHNSSILGFSVHQLTVIYAFHSVFMIEDNVKEAIMVPYKSMFEGNTCLFYHFVIILGSH